MRDGTKLATDVYLPLATPEDGIPTLLVRSAYGRDLGEWSDEIQLFTLLFGFAAVIQDTRGRGDSEGIDSLFFSDGWGDVQDGYDTVEWIAAQSWSNGKVGMLGASALAISSYLCAGAAPPHLTCCVALVATPNLYEDALFYHGVYRKSLVDEWMQSVGNTTLLPFFEEHPLYSPVYDRLNLTTRFDSVQVPILHVGGWHDIFVQGTLDAFTGLQEHGGPGAKGNQKLIIGPWAHSLDEEDTGEISFPNADIQEFLYQVVGWLYPLLKEESFDAEPLPTISYYVMGDADQPDGPGNEWIEAETWPPESRSISFYLHENNLLSPDPPKAGEASDTFTYDPNDPAPTLGGRNLNIPAGSYDQSEIEERSDVVVYTTPELEDTLTICGRVKVVLHAKTDAADTDFSAKLCDVYPDGRSMLVADGIVRARNRNSNLFEEFITPNAVEEYAIDLWSTAIAFAPGHRVRLSISSSNNPRFDPNPNTGEPFRKATYTVTANQILMHDAVYPSALVLPVVDDYTWTSVEPIAEAPKSWRIMANYPNPFNSQTTIPVSVGVGESKTLSIYDIQGRLIKSWHLAANRSVTAVIWDGTDMQGNILPTGPYLARLSGEPGVIKLMLLK